MPEDLHPLSAQALRDAPNFSYRHRAVRLVWVIIWTLLARWTPPQMGAWRHFLLRCFGARLHPTASVRGGARVWYPPNLEMAAHAVLADGVECYNVAPVRIGTGTIISQRAFLCAASHDYTRASHPLTPAPITIGAQVWIAAEAFIGSGVSVPDGCVIGARAVVTDALEPWGVYAGNPAKRIRDRAFDAKV